MQHEETLAADDVAASRAQYTDRHMDTQTDKETDRQTDRQTESERYVPD